MYPKTIPGLYHRQVERFGNRVLAYAKDSHGRWRAHTWRQGARQVRLISQGLMALGVSAGDRVGILSETRLEWTAADMAIVCSGGITVGVYPSSTAQECAWILEHSGCEIVFCEDRAQLEKLRSVSAAMPTVKQFLLFEGQSDHERDVLSHQELLDSGAEHDARAPERYEWRWRAVAEQDLAMLVYTSGTTGPPKGVMLTHKNIYATVESCSRELPLRDDDLGVVFLPLAHSFQRVTSYIGMHDGFTGVFAERVDKIVEHMGEFKPTMQPAVPRIYEKIHARIMGRVAELPPSRQKVFAWAMDVGRQVSRLKRARRPIPRRLALEHRVADRLVLRKIRDVFGGRIRYMVSGAAPIGIELLEFFHAAGILILEGYGLTETTAPATVNRPQDYRFGTVGRPLPICEIRLDQDGEILIRGENVFRGYYRDEEATRAAFTDDGWFRTGDIGTLSPDNFLTITDRKKELIITAGGKNISPANLENRVKADPLISQCMVHGDKRKYLVALVTLDPDELPRVAKRLGLSGRSLEELVAHPKLMAEVQLIFDRVNRDLARFETIKYFRLLPKDLSVEDDYLTPTLKLKRRNIERDYRALLDEMYERPNALPGG